MLQYYILYWRDLTFWRCRAERRWKKSVQLGGMLQDAMAWLGRGSGDRANYCTQFEHQLWSVLLTGKLTFEMYDMIQFSMKLLGKHLCMFACFFMAQLLQESRVGIADPVKCCGMCQGECECGNCSLLFSQCPVGFMLFRCSERFMECFKNL